MDMDREYSNGAFIAGAEDYPTRWAAKAGVFRRALGKRARLGIAYGPKPRQALDLFLPEAAPRGLLVFVHGGYWMRFDREDWSHLAAGALARGWACAMPSYTLAPQARIREMTLEIEAACVVAAAEVAGPLVVTGHSSGGHLAARMGCADRHASLTARLSRVVPISPLAELEPLQQTQMNEILWIDAEEALAESPAQHHLATQAHVWVGAQERPAFLWQARTLSENWDCPWTAAEGQHHFDIIDGLESPDSPLTRACLDGL